MKIFFDCIHINTFLVLNVSSLTPPWYIYHFHQCILSCFSVFAHYISFGQKKNFYLKRFKTEV